MTTFGCEYYITPLTTTGWQNINPIRFYTVQPIYNNKARLYSTYMSVAIQNKGQQTVLGIYAVKHAAIWHWKR